MCYLLIILSAALTVANANGWFDVPTVCLCACWTFAVLDWSSRKEPIVSILEVKDEKTS